MKCPYCGAEVVPNTKCEYCDSFVERERTTDSSESDYHENLEKIIIETAEHFADGLQTATENLGDTVKQVATPENKRIFKKILISITIAVIVIFLLSLIFVFSAFRSAFSFMSEMSDLHTDTTPVTVQKSKPDARSLTDEKANVKHLDSDGNLTLSYDGEEFESKLIDETLLRWLNDHDHSLDGVDVLFTTDAEGNVTSLAMSSQTFFVLDRQEENYLILRGGDVFRSTADIPLDSGTFYGGYFNYPALNAHVVFSETGNGYSMFDPMCNAKEIQLISDCYTGEDIPVPMICIDDTWYYCSKEVYDACTPNQVIPLDICKDTSMALIYTDK